MANEQESKGSTGKHGDLLSSFLVSVDGFTERISAQAAAAAPEGNERLVIQSTGESLVAQTKKLTDYVRRVAAAATSGQRRELDEFMRVQDGDAIATRAVEVMARAVASPERGSAMRGFLSWLQEHFKALKKIILGILGLLFGDLPAWVFTINTIIDELFDLLASLLGGVFGLRVSQVADELHQGEMHFLHELTALASLQAAAKLGQQPLDEEA